MIGGVVWVSVCVLAGYFFGNIPIVKQQLQRWSILAIIVVSVLPAVIEGWRQHRRARR